MFTAAEASTVPKPYQLWYLNGTGENGDAGALLVVQAGSATYGLLGAGFGRSTVTAARAGSNCRAVEARICLTSRQVSAGLASSMRAITPAVTGVADDVPFIPFV